MRFRVQGAIRLKWLEMKKAFPDLEPIAEERAAKPSRFGTTGRYQRFETKWCGAAIHLHTAGARAGSAFITYGDICSLYVSMGGSRGPLGFPISDEEDATCPPLGIPRGRVSKFEGGYILWDAHTRHMAVWVCSDRWNEAGLFGEALSQVGGVPTYVIHGNLIQGSVTKNIRGDDVAHGATKVQDGIMIQKAPTFGPSRETADSSLVCPNCGRNLPAGQPKHCPNCNRDLASVREEVDNDREPVEEGTRSPARAQDIWPGLAEANAGSPASSANPRGKSLSPPGASSAGVPNRLHGDSKDAESVGWLGMSTKLAVRDQSGKPVSDVDVLLVAGNGTYLKGQTDSEGKAHFRLAKPQLMTVFCAHPYCPSFFAGDFNPGADLAVTLQTGGETGSMISMGGWNTVPGLSGEISPIHDSSNRLYVYTENIAVDGGKPQPIAFQTGQPLHFEDAAGHERMVTFTAVVAQCFLVEYKNVRS